MDIKKYIYDSGIDAFTYSIVFVLSVLLPTIISLIYDKPSILLLSMFINALGLIRDYYLLFKHKKTSKRFWIERIVGFVVSVIIALYSVIALVLLANKIIISSFGAFNISAAILFLCPCIISVIEAILYTKKDYKENVVEDSFTVAQGLSTSV